MSPTGPSGPGVLRPVRHFPGVWRRMRLFDVVLWSVLPLALCLYLFGASVVDYARMRNFDDWWSAFARVDHFAWWRVRSALELPHAVGLDHGLSVEDTHRALVDLRVDRAEFDRMADDPVGRAGMAVTAQLVEGDAASEVELRLRGDTSVHWTAEKKTLAMKSARGEMFQGNRTTVFSAKEVLPQFAANSMALDFGLIATPTAVVPVFLNQRFYGMFRAFAPLDETFLRNAGRIPGNIFRGDTAERGDAFKYLPRELFLNPYIWDRVAANDRPGAIGTAKLAKFVALVEQVNAGELAPAGEPQALERLFEILDRDEISRLFALMLVVGDPWHTSGVHNHFWYEDSSSGLLHPIPWDLRTLDLDRPPPGANYNRFWRAALSDPRVFAGALREIHERNRDGKLLEAVTRRVEDTWQRYRDGFEYDALRCGPAGTAPNPEVGTADEVLATLRKNVAKLETWCADARASVVTSPDAKVIDVVVLGRAPVEIPEFVCLASVHGGPAAWSVSADTDLDGVPSAGDTRIAEAALGSTHATPVREAGRIVLLPGIRARQQLEVEPLVYRFFVTGHVAPSPVLRNALDGSSIHPGDRPVPGSALPTAKSAHPWSFREPEAREIRLAGTQRLTETLEVPRGATLLIEPGTRLVLEPDVSIHVLGRVIAEGSASAPIELVNAVEKHPWGSLALLGSGADGSLFRHVKFKGGGGALLDDFEYTGMVCVHWARGVRFEDCEFSDNLRCDDALHVDVGDATVTRCWFHDTNADALDFDISTGTIEASRVERAGNDGFDLMTCSPRIVGNVISGNGDKGISVGENSSPFVFANTITGCNRGVEVKDRSSPLLLANSIVGNKTGVLARLKNWRYEKGGWPRLVHSRVAENGKDLVIEQDARLTRLERPDEGKAALAADARWIYLLEGISPDVEGTGVDARWRPAPTAGILDEERFVEFFAAPGATWRRTGGVTGLRVEDQSLLVRLGADEGAIARDVDWTASAGRTRFLVLESSASDVEAARVRLGIDGAPPLETPLVLDADPERSSFTVIPLGEARVRELALSAVPRTRIDHSPIVRLRTPGALRLHRWFVVSAETSALEPAR